MIPQDREFFEKVARAGSSNPFSDEHAALELDITGLPASAPKKQRTQKLVYEVQSRISRLEAEGKAQLKAYSGQDQRLMVKTFLFELFYRLKDQFDQLIKNQLAAGEATVKIPFFNDALSATTAFGFTEEAFRHYFALGYQVALLTFRRKAAEYLSVP